MHKCAYVCVVCVCIGGMGERSEDVTEGHSLCLVSLCFE